MIWIIFAVLTAVVIAVLVWPVVKGRPLDQADDRDAYDRAVFRDQLAELDRDVERGMIAGAEAEAARNEISRRLIAATAPAAKRAALGSPAVALLAALVIPAVALPLYLRAGSPGMPDIPRAQRIENAARTGDFDALIVQVEEHLASKPDDVEGWKVLAPAYRRAERWSDAAEAQRNILRLSEPTPKIISDYGESLVLANRGMVSAEARGLFAEALRLDPKFPMARFYDALALKQEGRTAEAKTAFEAFLADTPADAPWRDMLVAELQDMASRPPALDQQAMEQAGSMSTEDRQAMIRTMVDGLEERLKADASDLDGWLRLIRARGVLGDAERAKVAYAAAKDHFRNDPRAIAQLDGLAKEMNIP